MKQIMVQPDVVRGEAQRYVEVVRRVERAGEELLATLTACEGALGREVQDTMTELRWSVRHGIDVLAHDHRQVQAGLLAVGECYRQLDQATATGWSPSARGSARP